MNVKVHPSINPSIHLKQMLSKSKPTDLLQPKETSMPNEHVFYILRELNNKNNPEGGL